MLLAFSNCMYMYALLFLTAHKMYLNILFIFWPHRLQFSPTKFSSSRMVAVGPGCWSIYSKILHVKRIPYAKYMNLLFHRSALYRRLPYIIFFLFKCWIPYFYIYKPQATQYLIVILYLMFLNVDMIVYHNQKSS